MVGFDDGRISVYAGCNRGSGSADLIGGVLVTQLALTMMACPPPVDGADRWLAELFGARPRWTLSGDTLTLATDAATVTLRDKRVVSPARSLAGTTWTVRSLVSPQVITTSVALEQAHPTLTITDDGGVSGWTGCNRFTGHAGLSPGTVDFGPLALTRMACPDDIGEIEQAVLRVLAGPVRATVDDDLLRLQRDDGYGLVLGAQ